MQAAVEVLQAQGAVVCALQGLRLTMAAQHPATGVFDIANNDDQRPIGVILFRERVGRPFCRRLFRFLKGGARRRSAAGLRVLPSRRAVFCRRRKEKPRSVGMRGRKACFAVWRRAISGTRSKDCGPPFRDPARSTVPKPRPDCALPRPRPRRRCGRECRRWPPV